MLVLEAGNIKKFYGERLLFKLDELKVYSGERIGITGLNGAGKTTLINILTKQTEPDEGYVSLYGSYSYIKQLDEAEGVAEKRIAGEFGVSESNTECMSGGEKTRLNIARSLSVESSIMFADEPTCNLDMKGIQLLEERLKRFKGALFIVSHDRALLDNLCTQMLEIDEGKVTIYSGNYTAYKNQKEAERNRQQFEYEEYVREKEKLEAAIEDRKQRVKSMKKAPSRMGNSEARLHTRAVNGKKAKVDRAAKIMETRIEKLEKKEKPREIVKTRIDIQQNSMPISKIVINCKNLSKSFGVRTLFSGVGFEILNGIKVGLVGDNGTGKTTLVNMILSGENGVKISNGVKIGYFSQSLDTLDSELSILENVLKDSVHPESFVRTVLARLLFKRDDVHKKVKLLSGGERVKVSLAKIFVTDANVLILDEPTNYLDVYSQEALEDVLTEYEGTVLFTSHDRRFINEVADKIILLADQKAVVFEGNYEEYIEHKQNSQKSATTAERRMLLESRLAQVMGKLSKPPKGVDIEALDREYMEILGELKEVR